jgi:DNA-directed RNA polymerase subunit RPC12/RpoP
LELDNSGGVIGGAAVSYVVCRRCGSRVPLAVRLRSQAPIIFAATCPACGFRGKYSYVDIVEEGVYRARCAVCSVRLYSFRLGRVRCPVCGSKYIVSPGGWQLLERGELPPSPARTLATVGMFSGGISGASRGRSAPERIAGIVAGSVAGLIAGGLLGVLIEALTRAERGAVYLDS